MNNKIVLKPNLQQQKKVKIVRALDRQSCIIFYTTMGSVTAETLFYSILRPGIIMADINVTTNCLIEVMTRYEAILDIAGDIHI